jgi:hypothetical protein
MNPKILSYNLWAESEIGLKSNDGPSIGLTKENEIYLKNRLYNAFLAGYDDGERAKTVEIARKVEKFLHD